MTVFILEPNGQTNTAKYVGNIIDEFTYVFTSRDSHYPPASAISVFGNYRKVGALMKLICYMLGWLKIIVRLKKNDAFHFHWLKLSFLDFLFILILKFRGINVVGTVHNILPHESAIWDKFFFGRIYRLADHLIFHTSGIQKEFSKTYFDSSKYTIIDHYYDPVKIDSSVEKSNQLLFFGNIRPYKGLELLIESTHLLEGYELDLIVAGKPEYSIQELQNENKSIDWRVEFIDDQEVEFLFNSSAIIVLPYLKIDTSGLLYLAKSYGKIVIAPDMGIFSEHITHDVNGLLFAPGDKKDLAEKISYVLKSEVQQRLKAKILTQLPSDSIGIFRKEHQNLYDTLNA